MTEDLKIALRGRNPDHRYGTFDEAWSTYERLGGDPTPILWHLEREELGTRLYDQSFCRDNEGGGAIVKTVDSVIMRTNDASMFLLVRTGDASVIRVPEEQLELFRTLIFPQNNGTLFDLYVHPEGTKINPIIILKAEYGFSLETQPVNPNDGSEFKPLLEQAIAEEMKFKMD